FNKLIFHSHADLDLLIQSDVNTFFKREKPDIVILAAAKVGGINANNTYRGQFLYENLTIQNNVIHAAHEFKVKKLLFLGSACIYPKEAIQPIKEEYLLSNYLESTNEPYAIAKIAGIKLCENYYNQYGDNFISIMPNNLYGPNDNFNLQTSHVLPALLRKFHEGKQLNSNFVEIWGTGSPLREFLHVDDMANACLFMMSNISAKDLYGMKISHLNVGSNEEISIKELALLIKKIVGFSGELVFNNKYPDGMLRKLLDAKKIINLGWVSKIKLKDGIKSVYQWYLDNMRTD
ncbi:MAG: GDP-L-fucose synthase, partial [Candidatus Marinimicrobia bacterium]|nr:GDP-L-fucose synthase [Candidatus Neomarinimicrobiota bacterium]